jgi:hypothetical protein
MLAYSGARLESSITSNGVTGDPILEAPVEVTLSELAIESFFPADEATGAYLRGV